MTNVKSRERGLEPKMSADNSRVAEAWQPLPNVAPDTHKNRVLFGLRLFFDLEVATTYWDVKEFLSRTKKNVLEVGCGLKPYRHLVPAETKYFAIDSENSQARFCYKTDGVQYYKGSTFPVQNSVFDSIFHTEVLEHIYDPHKFLSECSRVLSVPGRMFFTVPFAARYHYIPNDYWRFTPASLERLLKETGFKSITVKPRGSDVTVAISKVNAVFFRLILSGTGNPVLRMIYIVFFGFFFAAPIILMTIIGHLSILFKIGSTDDPLGYSVYCVKTNE